MPVRTVKDEYSSFAIRNSYFFAFAIMKKLFAASKRSQILQMLPNNSALLRGWHLPFYTLLCPPVALLRLGFQVALTFKDADIALWKTVTVGTKITRGTLLYCLVFPCSLNFQLCKCVFWNPDTLNKWHAKFQRKIRMFIFVWKWKSFFRVFW